MQRPLVFYSLSQIFGLALGKATGDHPCAGSQEHLLMSHYNKEKIKEN